MSASPNSHRAVRRLPRPGTLARHATLIALALFMGLPLLWMVGSSMKRKDRIVSHPLEMPERFTLTPFRDAWVQGEFGRHFGNSLIVTGCAIVGVILLASMAGFVLARFPLPGSPLLRTLFMVGLLLPVEGILIPLHALNESLGISESRFALILPYVALELPVAIFLFQAFFSQIPREIEEAARMDGCRAWSIYWRIFLPMGAQVTGVVAILVFLAFWNEFLLANFLVSEESIRTMPAAFNNFYGRHRVNYQLVFAGLSIYVVPAVVFYLLASRWIARSVTAGALKG